MKKGVQKIFSEVVETYELVNHLLTCGLDIKWRKRAARIASQTEGDVWLDICTGTGEMARNLDRFARGNIKIISLDFCFSMLLEARKKKIENREISFIQSDVRFLPFNDETIDVVTISFATRNLGLNSQALLPYFREFWRVLKPGGNFINLETSQPRLRIIRRLLHFYARVVVRLAGSALSGSKSGYAYLSYTIPRFIPARELKLTLGEAGFISVRMFRLFLGIAYIHIAQKKGSGFSPNFADFFD